MRKHLVLTLTGPDRIGIVEHVTKILLEYNGNVEASKMAHLGGEFAMLMLVSVSVEKFKDLQLGLQSIKDEGYKITTRPTEPDTSARYSGWMPYELKINGADHEGIIHHITHCLAEQSINIETADTSIVQAPMSGTPLFTMTAIILVPQDLSYHNWRDKLDVVADEANINIEVSPYTG